jgi:putative oxidoreductase
MKKSYWVDIISSLFILLFIYTAINKFIDLEKFRQVLRSSPLIREKGNIVAWLIPLAEIGISILLFFPKTRKTGLWGTLLLMSLFTGYIAYMVFISDVRPCSCGGIIEKMTWTQHFIFNVFFTLLAGLSLWLNKKRNKDLNTPLQFSTSA